MSPEAAPCPLTSPLLWQESKLAGKHQTETTNTGIQSQTAVCVHLIWIVVVEFVFLLACLSLSTHSQSALASQTPMMHAGRLTKQLYNGSGLMPPSLNLKQRNVRKCNRLSE